MLITTRYVGPTNTKGARIRVQCGDTVKFYPYGYGGALERMHTKAAMRFAREVLKLAPGAEFIVTQSLDGWAYIYTVGAEYVYAGME